MLPLSLVSVFVLWLWAHHWGLCFRCNLLCQGEFIVCRYNLLVSLFSPLSIHLTILVSWQFVSCSLVSLCLSPAALLLLPSKLKGLSQTCLSLSPLSPSLLWNLAESFTAPSCFFLVSHLLILQWASVCVSLCLRQCAFRKKIYKWSILYSM